MPIGSGIDLVFEAALCQHPSLRSGLGPLEAFARNPGTHLVAPLEAVSLEEGRFSFGTEAPITLAEVLAHQRKLGQPCGTRAGLQLIMAVLDALGAAQPAAHRAGRKAHGTLNPWRIALMEDGTAILLGYGLPDVELLAYFDEVQSGVSIDTLRYAAPERLDDQEQDSRSDLYALAIIAAELMLGRPVFDGTPTSVVERVIRGDAPELIEALGRSLGEALLDLLCVATEPDVSERFRDLDEFRKQATPLQGTGPTLVELIAASLAARPQPRSAPAEEIAPPPPPEESNDFDLAPEVGVLPASADLETIRSHARQVVERARQLAEQAMTMQAIAEQRAADLPTLRPVLRRLKDAVARSEKAAASTASTARLVELDDDPADARITLDMVRSAEKLCASSTKVALDLLEAVQSEIDEARAEQEMLNRAKRLAAEAAERAREAAQDAEQRVSVVEADLARGAYTYPEAALDVAEARAALDLATKASKRAATSQQTVARHGRGAEALREAESTRTIAEEAEQARDAARVGITEIDQRQRDATEVLMAALNGHVARAQAAALDAEQSLARATPVAATAPGLAAALQALDKHVRAARAAATEAERDAGGTNTPLALGKAVHSAGRAADLAETQAQLAADGSDALVAKAGAAAAHAAKLSKLRTESEALAQRILALASSVADAWQSLRQDTEEVEGRIALDAVQVAQKASEKVEEAAHDGRVQSDALAHEDDLGRLELAVDQLRATVDELRERAERALARCREARGAAARELDEIAARRRKDDERLAAVAQAAGHAEVCEARVAAAWVQYHKATEALSLAAVDGLETMRVRAYEIIDVAEYQAGEARAAANAAKSEREPAEARSHASTASSFEDRVDADLPEALQILERIQRAATAELDSLADARGRTAIALDAAREAVRAIEEMRVSGKYAARDWLEDPKVDAALSQLIDHSAHMSENLEQVRQHEEAAREATSAEIARAAVSPAESATAMLVAAREHCERVSALLDKAVRSARTEIEARDTATRVLHASLETVRGIEGKLTERAKRLFEAIDRHEATGEVVRECRRRMRKAIDGAGDAHDKIARGIRMLPSITTSDDYHTLQTKVEGQVSRVEGLLEEAADAETEGVAAAAREATERVESERRRLTHARTTALAHLNTAKGAAAKSVVLLREANLELNGRTDPKVLELHQSAGEWVRRSRNAATSALSAARKCQRAKSANEALAFETQAAELAADAHAAVGQAKILLHEAMDRARRQEVEAEALANVKVEVGNLVAKVAAGVKLAMASAGEVVEVTAGSTDPETLATVNKAEDLVNAIHHASAKVDAAAPLIADSQTLDVAQKLLNTCRLSLERVEAGAEEIAQLVQTAQGLLSREADRAAQRISDARLEAIRPAEEAAAIAQKAEGWLETGRRAAEDHREHSGVQEALQALEAVCRSTQAAATAAKHVSEPAKLADSVDEARSIGDIVAAASRKAMEEAEKARAALERVKAAIDDIAKLNEDAQEFRVRAGESAAAAEICASEAASIAEDLERHISASGINDDEVAQSFREVKRAAKAIAGCAAAAFESTESTVTMTTLAAVQAAARQAEERRREGETMLQELQQHDRAGRERIESLKRSTQDASKRSKDEALRARLRKKRSESTVMKREELQRQFEAEREEPEKPNLSALRDRLRSRRKPESIIDGSDASSPRRIGDRPRRRRGGDDAPSLPAPDLKSRLRASRDRPSPDESSRLRPPVSVSDSILGEVRSQEEREASRRRRLERRHRRDGTEAPAPTRPPVSTSRRVERTAVKDEDVGIVDPDDLEEYHSEAPPKEDLRDGADALLRRLRRRRDD